MANYLSLFTGLQSGDVKGTVKSEQRRTGLETSSPVPESTPVDGRMATPKQPVPIYMKGSNTPELANFIPSTGVRPSWSKAISSNPQLAIWAAQHPEDAAKLKAAKYSP